MKYTLLLCLFSFCILNNLFAMDAPSSKRSRQVRSETTLDKENIYLEDIEVESLHSAARDGHLALVKQLLAKGVPVNVQDSMRRTPLHYAACGHLQIVRLLIAAGADLFAKDNTGHVPLDCALGKNSDDIIRELMIEMFTLPKETEEEKEDPALFRRNSLKAPLATQAELSEVDSSSDEEELEGTAAANQEQLKSEINALAVLARKQLAVIMEATQNDQTSVVERAARKYGECQAKIEILGATIPSIEEGLRRIECLRRAERIATHALWRNRTKRVKDLVAALQDGGFESFFAIINTLSREEQIYFCHCKLLTGCDAQAIHVAADVGDGDALATLINRYGASLKATAKNDETVLHYAARRGHLHLIKTLIIDYHLDVDLCAWRSRTPLHFAAIHGEKETVEALLRDHKANVEAEDYYGFTPLFYAVIYGHEEIIKILLDTYHAKNTTLKDTHRTLLHYAAFHGHASIFRMLIDDYGMNVEAKDYQGRTALHLATLRNHIHAITALIAEHNAYTDVQDRYNRTPLHIAASKRNTAAINILTAHQADLEIPDAQGNTPLDCAIKTNADIPIIQALLSAGAILWKKSIKRATVSYPEIVTMLLSHGKKKIA